MVADTDVGVATTGAVAMPGPFAVAADAIRALQAIDLDALSPEELNDAAVAFGQLGSMLDAAAARTLSRWEASKAWRLDGARSPAAWLAAALRLPVEVARERARHARELRDLPAIWEAWAAGEIDRAHVRSLLAARNPRTTDAFERDHHVLLEAARIQTFRELVRTRDRWRNIVDADGAERSAADEHAQRSLHLDRSIGGMWFGRLTLDRISGEIVRGTLAEIERELFDADWAAAKARLGREPHTDELGRTPTQRRADALVEMATRARTAPADGRRPAPLFTVVVDYGTLAGPILELLDRTAITPGQAAPWLTEAYLERIVFDSASRVIDLGVPRRFFTDAQRRAITIRDRTCFHPTCDEVPDRVEIDHVQPAAWGGPTTLDNGRLACRFHNHTRPFAGSERALRARAGPRWTDAGPDPPDR